jgi:hypothetical protein
MLLPNHGLRTFKKARKWEKENFILIVLFVKQEVRSLAIVGTTLAVW